DLGIGYINTLRITGNSTNNITNGFFSARGVLITAGAAQINNGTFYGPYAGELIIHQFSGTAAAISSVIADNDSSLPLIKSGTGVLMLTGTNANAYIGGTLVNQGTLQIGDTLGGGNSGSLGSGPVTLYSGTLQINKTNDLTIANSISG